MDRPRHIVRALFWVTLGAACGCGSSNCMDPWIQISAGDMLVKSLSLSGPGCENATIHSYDRLYGRCGDGFTPHCQYYTIRPGAAGECTVHIELENGMAVDKTASFVYSGGDYCAGYYPQGGRQRWSLPDLFSDAGAG
jgi:hypothetical protein